MYDLYRKKFCRLRGSDEMDLSEVLEKSDMLKKKKNVYTILWKVFFISLSRELDFFFF